MMVSKAREQAGVWEIERLDKAKDKIADLVVAEVRIQGMDDVEEFREKAGDLTRIMRINNFLN